MNLRFLLMFCVSALFAPLAIAQPPKAPPAKVDKKEKLSALDAALEGIQRRINDLVKEAKAQKNTVLVTETLEKHREEISKWLEGQEWEFTCQVVDIESTEGIYVLKAKPTKSLMRFAPNYQAKARGGISAFEIAFQVDQSVVREIGRGDYMEVKGKVSIEDHVNHAAPDIAAGDGLPVFSLYLPLLDGRQTAIPVSVGLAHVTMNKATEPKK